MSGERIYIGIGSNVGDRVEHCERAIGALARLPGVTVVAVSSLYESAPVPPASGRWFVNGVVSVVTTSTPEALLRQLHRIERRLGRPAVRARGEDRTIDLDLLLVGSRIIDGPELVVPHPRLHQRRFVMVPLCELAPDLRHPILGLTMRELLGRLDDHAAVRLLDEGRRLVPAT
jgi:2-amino-4-hydroxy-6-hydroxymethyldihydropteridine diphosphokinase